MNQERKELGLAGLKEKEPKKKEKRKIREGAMIDTVSSFEGRRDGQTERTFLPPLRVPLPRHLPRTHFSLSVVHLYST